MTDESPVVMCYYCQKVITTDPVEYRGEKYHTDCYQNINSASE